MAKRLGISKRRIRTAGIKDKRAVTAQHISLENIRLEALTRVQLTGVKVYPLRYSSNMVFPHMSFGNSFRLTIRNLSHSTSVLHARISRILEKLQDLGGVPNYFGHQRFGTVRPITHLVGKALAQDNLSQAASVFLANPSPYEHPQSRAARQQLQATGDFQEALDHFPRRLVYERLMLQHLAKHPNEYVGAFKKLPHQLCRLFLHAYQSYLFNRFLSQRLTQAIPINEPQIGDYVVKTDRHGLTTRSYVVVTSENLNVLRSAVEKSKMYVALPLIGYKQAPSQGVQGEIERNILDSEGMTQGNFHVSSMPQLGAPGRVRAALTPIINLEINPCATDELNDGKRKLRLCFTLHRGCYATVVLREFMKPPNLIKAGF
jgi:tRNA pseudouridine13 synthase